jgi:ferredoxin
VKSSNEVSQSFPSTLSSKELLFPQCETLFTFELHTGDVTLEEPPIEEERMVLFGLPPCEARSIVLLQKAFASDEFQDPYYLHRKANAVIIGKSCEHPLSTCFCSSVGGSPFGTDGVDLLLQDLGEKYFLQVLTATGEALVDELPGYEEATQADVNAAKRIATAVEASFKTRLELQGVEKKLEQMFEDPLWDVIYQKCVGCGVCTYLCPTCYCFDIVDEAQGSIGKRIRIWDSCQFSLFTLQGSGENPRPTGKERMRQRIMHKFNYYPLNHGGIACVGCGRCIRECPVNLDIREILNIIVTK